MNFLLREKNESLLELRIAFEKRRKKVIDMNTIEKANILMVQICVHEIESKFFWTPQKTRHFLMHEKCSHFVPSSYEFGEAHISLSIENKLHF